jgi:hypothetical protein
MRGTTATDPYIYLPMGDDVVLFPEDDVNAAPVDLSHQNLRRFSPFILEVIPPHPDEPWINGNPARVTDPTQKPFRSPLNTKLTGYNKRYNQAPQNSFAPKLSSLAGPPVRPTSGTATSQLSDTIEVSASFNDRDAIIDYVVQHRALATLPPIVFLINPSSFDVSYNAIQAFQEQTRYGFVFQRWGEELPTISISTSIGAFVAERLNGEEIKTQLAEGKKPSEIKAPNGLTHLARKDSAGYRHLMSIFSVYRNSVAIADRIGQSRAYSAIGTQAIHYDGQTWEGRIESMSYTYEEGRQNGGISFDLSFVVYKHYFNESMTSRALKRLRNLNAGE